MSYIKGKFSKILFQSDDLYYVCLFRVLDTDEDMSLSVTTVTGYFYEINTHDTYLLRGKVINHPKYGKQYAVDYYELLPPEDKDSIVEFLSSDLFPGVGEKTALAIFDKFKKETVDVILRKPEELLLVPKLSQKLIDTLHQTMNNYQASYKLMLELIDYGFSPKEATKIISYFKTKTKELIDTNLYDLRRIKQFSFRRIDEIALKNNYLATDSRRVKSAILYALEEVANLVGDVYLDEISLFNKTKKVLALVLEYDDFRSLLDELIQEDEIHHEDNKYYLMRHYLDEELIASKINRALSKTDDKSDEKLLEKISKIEYNEEQKEAILLSMSKNFLVISGGPGTGKTTIIKAIVDLYQAKHKLTRERLLEEVVLLSPTGRASKRLSELSMMPSSTIHRFLKWNGEEDGFYLNENNKSSLKLLIVDEASMIDLSLMASLFKALLTSARIILVGDYNQLTSVGPGQVLKDIIESNQAPMVFLKDIYRQKENSNIINLAYALNEEKIDSLESSSDLELVDTRDLVPSLLDVASKYKKTNYRKFQILAPMYKGINGIDNLNNKLQELFNPKDPKKNERKVFEQIYREGDKVIQLVNMPDYNVYNGDIGLIKSIDKSSITILFDDNLVTYTSGEYQNFSLAYVISIHKAQGSEFDYVILPISSTYRLMLYKKLYYTAITRAKKKLYLIGDISLLDRVSKNNYGDSRKTSLKEKINLAKKQ